MSTRTPISERYDLEYHRRGSRWGRGKRMANWGGLAAAVVVCTLWWVRGDQRVYQSHPVSAAHADFAQDCAACHQQPWQPALRLLPVAGEFNSVSDAACLTCHQVELGEDYHQRDHHAARCRGDARTFGCADCHREHRPDQSALVQVENRYCIGCHENLTEVVNGTPTSADGIAAFDASHPPFAHEQSGATTSRDYGGIKFNHAHHLSAENVKANLACADCHQPTPDGRRMQPVHYESHCAQCHSLRLEGEFATLGELPHGEPELVNSAIHDWVQRQSPLANSSAPASLNDEDFPIISPLLKQSGEQPDRDQIAQVSQRAQRAIFSPEAKGHCRKCHHVVAKGEAWKILNADPHGYDDLAPATDETDQPIVPARWLRHAQFDHARHQTLACTECHEVNHSEKSEDILLPSMQTCLRCHGADSKPGAAAARSNCVTCHTFHDEAWEIIPAAPAVGRQTDLAALAEFMLTLAPPREEAAP